MAEIHNRMPVILGESDWPNGLAALLKPCPDDRLKKSGPVDNKAIDEQGEVHLRRVSCAVDTGIAINPDTIMAQLEGGLSYRGPGTLERVALPGLWV